MPGEGACYIRQVKNKEVGGRMETNGKFMEIGREQLKWNSKICTEHLFVPGTHPGIYFLNVQLPLT